MANLYLFTNSIGINCSEVQKNISSIIKIWRKDWKFLSIVTLHFDVKWKSPPVSVFLPSYTFLELLNPNLEVANKFSCSFVKDRKIFALFGFFVLNSETTYYMKKKIEYKIKRAKLTMLFKR